MLTLVEDLGMRKEGKSTRRWCTAKCSYCNIIVERRTQQLNKLQSCGCATQLKAHIKHNCHKDRIYQIWADMKTRCLQPNNPRYHRYGGRGISVCTEWLFFPSFKEWADTNWYEDTLTIDRVDNDGNYEPSNCQWITVQENLKRRNRSNGWKSN